MSAWHWLTYKGPVERATWQLLVEFGLTAYVVLHLWGVVR